MAQNLKRSNINRRILVAFKEATVFQKVVVILSISALIISLTQPAFYIDREDYDAYANCPLLFFLGWMGLLGGSLESLLWVANPLYLIAVYLFITKRPMAWLVSCTALLMAISFALLPTILTSESGSRSKITSLQFGYILWVASMAILFAGSLVDRFFIKSSRVNVQVK